MQLTSEEHTMLDGRQGAAVQKAMQIVTALGEIYGAEHLVPVASAQVSGVSFKNLGDAGLEFLEGWAVQGARVRVPAYMNPTGMDLQRWREMGLSAEFAQKQQRVVAALQAMGVELTCTCTPYLVGHVPRTGEHLAWSESSAVSYANSVLGARSNREGGPSALAAAITGRTAAYGLHLDANRQPTHLVEVRCPLRSEADYGALGYRVGRQVGDGVPYLRLQGQDVRADLPCQEHLMALGAAMAASGAVALYHVEGVTLEAAAVATSVASGEAPTSEVVTTNAGLVVATSVAPGEEPTTQVVPANTPTIVVYDLSAAYAALDSPLDQIDFVSLGCPHSTLAGIARAAELLRGKRVQVTLWITTSRDVRERAEREGLVAPIEAAGGHVFADTCLVVAPMEELGFKAMATNSAKAAFYAPSHSGLQCRFGTLEQCITAALSGHWPGPPSEGSARL